MNTGTKWNRTLRRKSGKVRPEDLRHLTPYDPAGNPTGTLPGSGKAWRQFLNFCTDESDFAQDLAHLEQIADRIHHEAAGDGSS